MAQTLIPTFGARSARYLLSATAVCILVLACRDPNNVVVEPSSATLGNLMAFPATSPEAANMRVAQKVPTYGGSWFDSVGNLHAYVTNLSDSAKLRSELMARFSGYDPGDGRPLDPLRTILFHKGDYDFPHLRAWRKLIAKTIIAEDVKGYEGSGIRNYTNRIHIGASSLVAIEAINRIVDNLGIPREAVRIALLTPIKLVDSLTDSSHIRKGGRGVGMYWSNLGNYVKKCTVGVNVAAGTQFFTAAHCTSTRWGTDNSSQLAKGYQPITLVNVNTYMGYEASDPPLFNSDVDECCDHIEPLCRYSDVALFTYDNGKAPGSAGQGFIERTAFDTTGYFQLGSRTVTGTFEITDEYAPPEETTRLDKIGSATGWTHGTILDDCYHAPYENHEFMCSIVVQGMHANDGDSGGPAFKFNSATGTVKFAGIVFGVQYGGGEVFTLISRVDYIHREFSSFSVVH